MQFFSASDFSVLKNVQAITQQNYVVQVEVIKRHHIAVTVNIKHVYP